MRHLVGFLGEWSAAACSLLFASGDCGFLLAVSVAVGIFAGMVHLGQFFANIQNICFPSPNMSDNQLS